MLQGANAALKKQGSKLFEKLKKDTPEISSGFTPSRAGVTVVAKVLHINQQKNKDNSVTTRVQVWLDTQFLRENVPADAGTFLSQTELRVKVQHRHLLSADEKKELIDKGFKLTANAKFSPPVMNGEKTLCWNTTITLNLYNGKGLGKNVREGDTVTLRGLYYGYDHNPEKGDMKGWGVARIEKTAPSGMSNFHFTALAGHDRNDMIELKIDPDRMAQMDPEVQQLSEAAQAKDWAKKLVVLSQMSPECRRAAESVYTFPLQGCSPSSEIGEKLNKYVHIVGWTFTKQSDPDDKSRDSITTGVVQLFQVNESEEQPVTGTFSIFLWTNEMRTIPIANYENASILTELLRVAQGAIFGIPNVLQLTTPSDANVDFQTNCACTSLQLDLPRAIMRQGMEIPSAVASNLLSRIAATRDYYSEEKWNKNNPNHNAKVINMCETKSSFSPPLGYALYFISDQTMEEVNAEGESAPSKFRQFVEQLTNEERESYWPYWAGISKTCNIREGLREKAEWTVFKMNKFVIFAVAQVEVDRVLATPNFPNVEEAKRIIAETQEAKAAKLQQQAAEDAELVASCEAAEAAYFEAKRASEAASEQAPKRQKTSSEQEVGSQDELSE